ncbi:MAG: ATPase [Deinococcota bacterium]
MTDARLIFVVGLTGVGKSSTLTGVQAQLPDLELLPNRRDLTDAIIIPTCQRASGKSVIPVHDRLERFDYTRQYREMYPGGVVHALEAYLLEQHLTSDKRHIFDNIRGLDEVRYSLERFPKSRFIVLDAPPLKRLKRLATRADAFDTIRATRLENDTFINNLQTIEGAADVFDLYEVARLEAAGYNEESLLTGLRIITREHLNYNAKEAFTHLRENLNSSRLLHIDTSQLELEHVINRVTGWIHISSASSL